MPDETTGIGADASITENTTAPAVPNFAGTKHRVKNDTAEEEVSYEDLLSGYQQSKVSQKRFREASDKEKAVMQRESTLNAQIERAKSDPEFLAHLLGQFGIDPDKWSETRVLKILEREAMSPEAKRAYDAELRATQYEKQIKEREAAEKQARLDAMQQQVGREVETEVLEAINALGIKPTWEMIAMVAEQLEASIEGNGQRMDAKTALSRTHKKVIRDIPLYLESLPDDQFEASLPKSFLDRIRKLEMKRLTQNKPDGSRPSNSPRETPPKDARQGARIKSSTDDFFNRIEKQFSQG